MNAKQVFYAAVFVTFVQLTSAQSALAQYHFERHPSSWVQVIDYLRPRVSGISLENVTDPTDDTYGAYDEDIETSDTGYQSVIASSTSSASASADEVGFITASSNTQMTFNPDLVANGQVSALAINTAIAGIDNGPYEALEIFLEGSYYSRTTAKCWARFTLINPQTSAPPTQVKLKIKQSSSYTADPDFIWNPSHSFSIYKNGSSSPLLSSSSAGEVTFIDPAAVHGDYYTIVGEVKAGGGPYISRYLVPAYSMTFFGGSLEVTGEAEVSLVP